MTIFEEPDTLCQREGNKCKHRNKCSRYLTPRKDFTWEADYYGEYGQFCIHYVAIPKTANNPG